MVGLVAAESGLLAVRLLLYAPRRMLQHGAQQVIRPTSRRQEYAEASRIEGVSANTEDTDYYQPGFVISSTTTWHAARSPTASRFGRIGVRNLKPKSIAA